MATKGYADFNFEEEDDPITGAIKQSIAGMEDTPGMQAPMGEVPQVEGPEAAAAPAKPDYTKLGAFKDKMGPWNESNEKFQRPWDEMSERYKMLTVLSNFDPSKGLKQEGLIDALNAANIKGAKFSAADDDKLDATGLEQWNDYDGHEGIGDVITGFKTGKGTWSPWSPMSKEGAGGAPMEGAAGGGGGLMQRLQSGVPTDEGFLQMLLDAAQREIHGGTDREAILAQLGVK